MLHVEFSLSLCKKNIESICCSDVGYVIFMLSILKLKSATATSIKNKVMKRERTSPDSLIS